MTEMNQKKNHKKAGFTLIEIIAVLLLLAVIAVVATPRYLRMIEDAKQSRLDGALAAGLSAVAMGYGSAALKEGGAPTAAQVVNAENTRMPDGDFNYSFDGETEGQVTVTVWYPRGVELGASAHNTNAVWTLPIE